MIERASSRAGRRSGGDCPGLARAAGWPTAGGARPLGAAALASSSAMSPARSRRAACCPSCGRAAADAASAGDHLRGHGNASSVYRRRAARDAARTCARLRDHPARCLAAARHTQWGPSWDLDARVGERAFLDQDGRITTGFIEPHFLRRVLGGPKMVAPGLAAIETVLDLHSAARIGDRAHGGHHIGKPGPRRGSRDCRACRGTSTWTSRSIASTTSAVFAGDLLASHAAGCAFAKSTAMVAVGRPLEVVRPPIAAIRSTRTCTRPSRRSARRRRQAWRQHHRRRECSDGLPEHGGYKYLLRQAEGRPRSWHACRPALGPRSVQVQVQALIQQKARVLVHAAGLSPQQLLRPGSNRSTTSPRAPTSCSAAGSRHAWPFCPRAANDPYLTDRRDTARQNSGLGLVVALPLLLFAVLAAARDQQERGATLAADQVALARAAAAAADGFLQSDATALRALVALPEVRNFGSDPTAAEAPMHAIFEAFPNLETLGLIGPDGRNVRSLLRDGSLAPGSVFVGDRPYVRQALSSGHDGAHPGGLEPRRPGVPVVAIACPSHPPVPAADVRADWTVALGRLGEVMQSAVPDARGDILLVDGDGQLLVAPASTQRLPPADLAARRSGRGGRPGRPTGAWIGRCRTRPSRNWSGMHP